MWLSYTYLFVRMRINPHVYGISLEEVEVCKIILHFCFFRICAKYF